MLLCDLPEVILAIVLQRCVRVRACDDPTQPFKGNLPLLAVCRLWRRLATPLVYNHVFIRYGDQHKPIVSPFTRNFNVEEPAGVAVRTNLDLVAMVGCARAVNRVEINVHCLANPFPGWREIIQRMRAVASKWRVVELAVAMHPNFLHFDGRNVDMSKYADDIVEVGGVLAALMPDVCRLKCGGAHENPIARSLYGRLAGHYADQLQQLNSRHPIVVPLDCRFSRLRRLHIDFDREAEYQLPRMASEELVEMSLVSGPANHSWASFAADGESQVIEFTNLKRLHVGYHSTYLEGGIPVRRRDGPRWALCFPSLRSLHIDCTENVSSLLDYALLPPRMESIAISMKSVAFGSIMDMIIPTVDTLSLSIMPFSGGDPSGLFAVNHMLESGWGCKTVELRIEDTELPVVPESITCTMLTHLQVSGPASVDTMLALIEKLPNLVCLEFHRLDMGDIQADISIPKADDDAAVEPLHTSLRALALNYTRERHSLDAAVAVAKYVLLGIPTLTELCAAQTPKSPVLSFVEAYAPRHLHLGGVKLKVYKNGGFATCSWDSRSFRQSRKPLL